MMRIKGGAGTLTLVGQNSVKKQYAWARMRTYGVPKARLARWVRGHAAQENFELKFKYSVMQSGGLK